jgi:hypothetical protein
MVAEQKAAPVPVEAAQVERVLAAVEYSASRNSTRTPVERSAG